LLDTDDFNPLPGLKFVNNFALYLVFITFSFGFYIAFTDAVYVPPPNLESEPDSDDQQLDSLFELESVYSV